MPSKPNPARAHLRPGPDFHQRAVLVTRQPGRVWFRVHKAGTPPVLFGKSLHHRFSHANCPFLLLYLGATIQTCLWEVFGDDIFQAKSAISSGKWSGSCLSQIIVPELKVCALNLQRTRKSMGVDKASLFAADLSIPQAWGLAVQGHPAGFEAITYASRFLDQLCLALFDRGGMHSKLQVKTLGLLSNIDAAVDWLDERKAALV